MGKKKVKSNMKRQSKKKLEDWLKRVCEDCHKFAIQPGNNLDFYVFLSSVKEYPKMLFIGANPFGDNRYDEIQKTDKSKWGVKYWNKLRGTKNNAYLANRFNKSWGPITESMCSIFYDDEFFRHDFEFNSVLMNIYYFNTTSIEGLNRLPHIKEIKRFCVDKTRTLINDIVHPEVIIALGNDAFDNLNQDKKIVYPLMMKNGKPLMKLGRYNSIPIIWLANPSKRNQHYYTPEYKAMVLKELKHLFTLFEKRREAKRKAQAEQRRLRTI